MEFFFPADVFATFPGQARSGPSNPFAHCGFGSQGIAEDYFADAIREERAAQAARARVRAAQQARAAAIQRARAIQRAAEVQEQKAAEDLQLRVYFEHVLGLHHQQEERARQRRAQQEIQLKLQQEYQRKQQQQREYQLRLQQQRLQEREEARRRQIDEYRRQQALEQERQRIAASARNEGKQLFLVLEDLVVGGLRALFNDSEPTPASESKTTTQTKATTATVQDVKGKDNAQDEATETYARQPAANATAAVEADPEELGPVPTSVAGDKTEEDAEDVAKKSDDASVLVFEHEFPTSNTFDKSSIRADAINISVDEAKRTVTVAGLWDNKPASTEQVASRPSSPALSHTSSASGSQRGRSPSPKRARVSDVDENGNEIVCPESQKDDDEDFVEVHFHKNDVKPATVQQTFVLPEGAKGDSLKAELTDQGLRLYASKA